MYKKAVIAIFSIITVLCLFEVHRISHYPVVVDMHGSKLVTLSEIKNNYTKNISQLAWVLQENRFLNDRLKDKLIAFLSNRLKDGLKKQYHVDEVYLSPILYPHDKNLYLTLDVVDKKSPNLANKKFNRCILDPDGLVKLWDEYEAMGGAYFRKYGEFPSYRKCLVNHCLFGFDLPEFKTYQLAFDSGVAKNKEQLIAMLKEDKDSHKRADAAFLLAHLKNPAEVVHVLLPSMHDPDPIVRNNVLRVIGFVLINNKNINIPLASLKNMLKLPLTTDRNKAMLVLLGLAQHTGDKNAIIQYFGADLYAELLQKQPNVHGLSYAILKEVSGKNYSDKDHAAWHNWLEDKHVSLQG